MQNEIVQISWVPFDGNIKEVSKLRCFLDRNQWVLVDSENNCFPSLIFIDHFFFGNTLFFFANSDGPFNWTYLYVNINLQWFQSFSNLKYFQRNLKWKVLTPTQVPPYYKNYYSVTKLTNFAARVLLIIWVEQ